MTLLRKHGSALTVFLWGALALVLAGAIGGFLLSRKAAAPGNVSIQKLLRYGAAPSFLLTDQDGQPFDSASLKGKVWVADFIFTSCAGTCPEMSGKLSRLQRRLDRDIQMVSVSVDPQRDTPQVLSAYARRFQAEPGRWHFLTGDREKIAALVSQGFGLSMAEGGSPEEPVVHSVRFVLVDSKGILRGYYDSTDPKAVDQMVQDANALD